MVMLGGSVRERVGREEMTRGWQGEKQGDIRSKTELWENSR